MKIVGKTTDGKFVFSGIFKIVSTYGLPLEDAVACIHKNGGIVSWLDLYKEALSSGMSWKRFRNELYYSIIDTYDKEFCEKVVEILDQVDEIRQRGGSIDP